jgi:hypothetical protein
MATLMMNDHADSASNDKPKLYYGVRKCDSLEGPAIFLNWTDCKFFVGSEKDDNIEYQSFERIVDAASYVTFQQLEEANERPNVDPKACSSSYTSLKRSADQASLPSPSGTPKKRLPKIPTLAPSTISSDTTETHSADDNHAYNSATDRPESPRGSAPVSKRQHDVPGRLKESNNVHGTASVVSEDCCEERFKGLNRFLVRWRCTVKRIADGRDKQTYASYEKIWKLIDLGVDFGVDTKTICKPESASRRVVLNYAFKRDIQLLKEYKEIYGTTVVMPEEHCYHGQFKERLWKFINLQQLVM